MQYATLYGKRKKNKKLQFYYQLLPLTRNNYCFI